MIERCPTCGAFVRVVSGDDGTSHYEPVALEALRVAERRVTALEAELARVLSNEAQAPKGSKDSSGSDDGRAPRPE